MKNTIRKIFTILSIHLLFISCLISSPIGTWYGNIQVNGSNLRIILHVEKSEDKLSSKFDSPDQKAFNIPFDQTKYQNNVLTCTKNIGGIGFSAKLINDTLFGTWNQNSMSFPLQLTKNKDNNVLIEKPKPNRPQEPKGKLNYVVEEVKIYNNKTGITLAGTLTKPKGKGPFPAVILISGSGPQDRNSEIFGHKPFLVLSDFLTKNGIAVLRYDDRGTANSTGIFDTATTADLADDAEAAFDFLKKQKNINPKKTGIIGHSEGGIIAPIIASRNKDVNFIVMIAGPGVPIIDLLLKQIRDISIASGAKYEDIKELLQFSDTFFRYLNQTSNYKNAFEKSDSVLKSFIDQNPHCTEDMITGFKQTIAMTNNPWFHYFINIIPETYLKEINCPVLAINGDLDMQVSSKENLDAIKKHLNTSNAPIYSIIEYEGLNHLMQNCETGAIIEYEMIEETFHQIAMQDIVAWILKLK